MFRKILVPIDTAEPAVAEPGVYFAAQLAALTNAAVRMVHVLPTMPLIFRKPRRPTSARIGKTRPSIRSLRWRKKLTFRWDIFHRPANRRGLRRSARGSAVLGS